MALRDVKILLVEDDDDDVYIAKTIMNSDPCCHYYLTHFTTFKDFIGVEHKDFDVILLDLGLPDSTGLSSVVEAVNHFRDIPVIVLTGLKSEELGEKAIQLGAEDYIPKDELNVTILSRSVRFSIERHSMMKKLRNMAHVDGLTLLSNRADYDERLGALLDFAQRHETQLGLIMIDLDGFKHINDTLGHNAGDQLLIQFSSRIKSQIRKTDVAARVGGDEFSLLLHPVDSAAACEKLAQMKLDHINEPFLIYADGAVKEVNVGMSMGIALYPQHGASAGELRENADKAMYEVKKHGKNNFLVFHDGL